MGLSCQESFWIFSDFHPSVKLYQLFLKTVYTAIFILKKDSNLFTLDTDIFRINRTIFSKLILREKIWIFHKLILSVT